LPESSCEHLFQAEDKAEEISPSLPPPSLAGIVPVAFWQKHPSDFLGNSSNENLIRQEVESPQKGPGYRISCSPRSRDFSDYLGSFGGIGLNPEKVPCHVPASSDRQS
jgi:hypothetical protein